MSLYNELGVPKNSDKDTIKRAYRRKAKKHHPDTPNGNKEAFMAIQRAYDVLGDDERRKRYDETGDDGQGQRQPSRVENLCSLMIGIALQKDPDTTDLIDAARGVVRESLNDLLRDKARSDAKADKFRRAAKRTKLKRPGDNVIAAAFERQAETEQCNAVRTQSAMDEFNAVAKLLDDYEYNADKPKPFGSASFTSVDELERLMPSSSHVIW